MRLFSNLCNLFHNLVILRNLVLCKLFVIFLSYIFLISSIFQDILLKFNENIFTEQLEYNWEKCFKYNYIKLYTIIYNYIKLYTIIYNYI